MIELQRLTGMRPGEVCLMRSGEIDTSDRIWTYTPTTHKAAHRDRHRVIPLGPRAQVVLRPWLRPEPMTFLFSPQEAMEEWRASQRRSKPTRGANSQRILRASEPSRRMPAEHYTPQTYRVAIQRACVKAGVPSWHPNQLRHNAATRLRKEFGLDVARAVLGHSTPVVTEIYAELDVAKAAEAMERIG